MTVFGFLGFGEAGAALATGLSAGGASGIVAYDIASDTSDLVRKRASDGKIELLPGPQDLTDRSDVIISAVVCTEAESAAESVAPGVRAGQWFLDINSVSPGVKTRNAARLEPRGVNYVDLAVMSNVSSDLARLPMLAAGPQAEDVRSLFGGIPTNITPVSAVPGDAARIKMFRSLMVKGLEALSLECMMACYSAGVHEQVLASLEGTFGKYTFPGLVQHLIGRHAVHGRRRGHELSEVADSLREARVEPIMAEAGCRRMLWDVDRGLPEKFDGSTDPDWLDVLDELDRLRQDESSA